MCCGCCHKHSAVFPLKINIKDPLDWFITFHKTFHSHKRGNISTACDNSLRRWLLALLYERNWIVQVRETANSFRLYFINTQILSYIKKKFYIFETCTLKSTNAHFYASATVSYLHLEENARLRLVLRFSAIIIFSRFHRKCDSLGEFRHVRSSRFVNEFYIKRQREREREREMSEGVGKILR